MYEVFLQDYAKKFLKKLDNSEKKKIIKKLKTLEEKPHSGKPLSGSLSGMRSLRINKFRAIYRIIKDKLIISVLEIGHRKNIYE